MNDPVSHSEWLTRKRLIDPKLKAAGWGVVPYDAAILGIVEAKKLSLGPQGVLTQAERYSQGVAESPFDFRGFRVPFPVLHQRRSHLAPRHPAQAEPIPSDSRLSHAAGID